jgi:hypothetical protein
METLNKTLCPHVKEIIAKPTRRKEQTLSTQLYSTRLIRQEERKDSKDIEGYLACGLWQLQEALLKVHPYIPFLLAVVLSSLTNHFM